MTLNRLNPNKESFSQSFGHWLLYSQSTPLNEGYQKPSLILSSTFPAFHPAGADVEPDVHFKHLPAEQHGMAQPEDLSHRELPPKHQRGGGLTWENLVMRNISLQSFISYRYCWCFFFAKTLGKQVAKVVVFRVGGVWMMAQSCFWSPSLMVKEFVNVPEDNSGCGRFWNFL